MIKLVDHKRCIHCDGSGRIIRREWGYTRQRRGRQRRGMHIYVSNYPCEWNAYRDRASNNAHLSAILPVYPHIEERREHRAPRRRNRNQRQGQIRPQNGRR